MFFAVLIYQYEQCSTRNNFDKKGLKLFFQKKLLKYLIAEDTSPQTLAYKMQSVASTGLKHLVYSLFDRAKILNLVVTVQLTMYTSSLGKLISDFIFMMDIDHMTRGLCCCQSKRNAEHQANVKGY